MKVPEWLEQPAYAADPASLAAHVAGMRGLVGYHVKLMRWAELGDTGPSEVVVTFLGFEDLGLDPTKRHRRADVHARILERGYVLCPAWVGFALWESPEFEAGPERLFVAMEPIRARDGLNSWGALALMLGPDNLANGQVTLRTDIIYHEVDDDTGEDLGVPYPGRNTRILVRVP